MISPEDDSRHDPGGRVDWAESGLFPISIPERLVSGWVLLTHRPGMAHSVGGLALWDPTGEDPHTCLYYDWGTVSPFDPSWDVFVCELSTGLTVSLVQPLEAVHVSYLRDECQADLLWTATDRPVPAEGAAAGSSGGVGTTGSGGGGFQQPGRLTGTLSVRGDILHVDGPSLRDRAWGSRPLRPPPRSDVSWALDEDGDGFRMATRATAEVAYDPVDGTTETLWAGWNRVDGVTRPLVSGTRRALARDPGGRPTSVRLRGEDDLGRELVADGECVNGLRWPGEPGTSQWWSLVRWRIRGATAWGEARESTPLELTRRHHRR